MEIEFAEGIEEIQKYAFAGCASLTNLYFPETLNNIGEGTFTDCRNLQMVSFPCDREMENISDDSFCGCPKVMFKCRNHGYVCDYAYEHGINTQFNMNYISKD